MKVTDIYYFSGTHWDREWYQTFQGFRHRLVDMVDELIDYLETDKEFGTYHFDGQTIVLEDYKAIAPENEGRLRKLIEDRKILIGPWYNMPDEFLVSGESLIRNLMYGSRLAKKWGTAPWSYGYICDIFGHIAQMPQIFNGFGINLSLLGRGTTGNEKNFFRWRAPDGSECINYVLPEKNGYGDFFASAVRPAFDGVKQVYDEEKLRENIKNNIDAQIARSNTPVLILMDGLDHQPVHKLTPKYIKIIKELYPDINVHHCNLEETKKLLDTVIDDIPVWNGEVNKTAIRSGNGYLHLISHTLSSYYTHKKMNDECQNKLEKVVEPMLALSSLEGNPFRRSYLKLAYDYLLKNHPHDSICGCSIAQVHKDMVYRFDQAREIAEELCEDYLYKHRPQKGDVHNYILKVYNPLPFERRETITADVLLGYGFPSRYDDPYMRDSAPNFHVIDTDGNKVAFGICGDTKSWLKRAYANFNEGGENVRITFEAVLPPCGYAEYKIVPNFETAASRYLEMYLDSGSNYAENEYIRLDITPSGEINILDKKTGKKYENLCELYDDSEIGDGWYHGKVLNDFALSSKGAPARIEKLETSPSRCVFRVTKLVDIPEQLIDLNGKRRSDKYVTIPFAFEFGLSREARHIDAKLSFKNAAKDHRVRLVLPTGVEGDTYFAGQAFCCNERKKDVNIETQSWREPDIIEKQMNGIVGKRDKDGNGIAFISSEGLHECAVYNNNDIMVTLLRAFQRTVNTMGEPEGQLIGINLSYSFILAPLDKDVTYADLVKKQDVLAVRQITSSSQVPAEYAPECKSYMSIEGENIALSIIKQPEEVEDNALIVRVYNASAENAKGKICFEHKIKEVYETNLNEDIKGKAKANKTSVPVSLTPWKIATYKIIFE